MKHLLTVILSILALVAAVTGCGGAHRYDARLVRTDSLMRPDPDSALAIVQAVVRDSLTSDGDRAYRDLLLTQARYRCYVPATSDSDINRALNYYRAHSGEREKLTRALIYKGAVMEELGHPDSAMLYYKQAEATAAADDYHNLGYTKYRISTLYQDQLTIDSSAIIYLKEAISCFEQENDTNYLISCYGNLGAVCGVKYPDSTEQYLTHAIELAQKYKPEKQYTYKSKLAGFYFYRYQDYRQAKDIAMDVYHNGRQFSYETQFYYYAAMSYIRLGMLDSAKFILKETPAPVCTVDSMNRFEVVAEIAKTENNLKDYSANISHSNGAQMRFVLSRQEDKLKKAESDYDKIQTQDHVERANRKRLLTAISIIVVILTMLLTWLTMRFKRAIKRKNEERNAIEHDLNKIITELEQKQLDQEQNQKTISKLVNYRLDALNELFGSIKFESKGEKKDNIRSIVSLSGVVRGLSDIYRVQKIDLSDDFWEKMKMSVDGEYNGIVSYVEKEYPSLTLRELRLFTLICAKVSPQIIKMCLNYSNVNSVTNKRTIIIKQKMGLDLSLETFIEKYMKNEL